MGYDNTDKGVLFKNRDKDPDRPTDRDYMGSINVGGTEYWLSAWINEDKNGKKYMSLSLGGIKEQRQPQAASAANTDFDDDIPF